MSEQPARTTLSPRAVKSHMQRRGSWIRRGTMSLLLAAVMLIAWAGPANASYFEWENRVQTNQVAVNGLSPFESGDPCAEVYFYTNFGTVSSSNMYVFTVSIRNDSTVDFLGTWYFRNSSGTALAGGYMLVPAGAWYEYPVNDWVGNYAVNDVITATLSSAQGSICNNSGYLEYQPFYA